MDFGTPGQVPRRLLFRPGEHGSAFPEEKEVRSDFNRTGIGQRMQPNRSEEIKHRENKHDDQKDDNDQRLEASSVSQGAAFAPGRRHSRLASRESKRVPRRQGRVKRLITGFDGAVDVAVERVEDFLGQQRNV